MSNLFLLAQTQPATSPAGGGDSAIGIMDIITITWLIISVAAIRKRKLYQVPPVPDLPTSTSPLALLAMVAAAVISFLSVLGVYASARHLDSAAMKTAEGLRQIVFAQPLAHIVVVALVLILLANLRLFPSLFYWPQARGRPIWHALATFLLVVPWVLLVGVIVQKIANAVGTDPHAEHLLFTVWQREPAGITSVKAAIVLSACVTAPIAEEIVFRGLLQRLIQSFTRSPAAAIVLSSLAFALVHEPWTLRPGVFVLSLFLGLAYFRTGSLLVPCLAHALFNAVNLGLLALHVT